VLLDKKGRDPGQLSGLTDTNKRVIVPDDAGFKIGEFVLATVHDATQNTLFCTPEKTMGVQEYGRYINKTFK